MPFYDISQAGFTLGYFLVPLIYFITICVSARIFLDSQKDSEKREKLSYNLVPGPLLLVVLLSTRALCLTYASFWYALQIQLVLAIPLILLNLFYILRCSLQLKFWIFYGVALFYVALYLVVVNWPAIDLAFFGMTFILFYCQVFLVGEVYQYVIRLVIEFVTRNSKLSDDPIISGLLHLSKWLLFYGYLGYVGGVTLFLTLSDFEVPIKSSPINLLLMGLFTPFFPKVHLFTDGLEDLFSNKPTLCSGEEDEREYTLGIAVKQYKEPTEELKGVQNRTCVSSSTALSTASEVLRQDGYSKKGDAFAAAARFVEAGTLDCTTTTEYGEVIKGSIPKPTSDTVGLFYMQNSEIHSNIDASKEKGLIGAMKAFAAHAVANTLAGTKNGAVSVRVTYVELKD